MKVYIVTGEPYPNGMAATSRVMCYARAIKEGGVNCEVAIFQRTELPGKINNPQASGIVKDVPYHYIGGNSRRHRIKYLRPMFDCFDQYRMARYLKRSLSKGDVLFLFMGSKLRLMLQYMKIAKSKGAFCVRDHCELAFGTGVETKEAIRLRKLTYERQFPLLDGVISISDTLLELAKEHTVPSCKHIKVPIMVDYRQYYLPDRSTMSEIPYIFHSGTLSEQKDGILGIIEAFGIATQRIDFPIRFISTGSINLSKCKNEMMKIIGRYGLQDKVIFTGFLSNSELKEYLSKASLVIINKYRTQQNIYCFSTKLGEYLAAAKPVIITNVGEAMNWLVNRESAYIIEPENTIALADAILHVFDNIEEAKIIGKTGQVVCKKCFDYCSWSKSLVDFLNKLGN